MNTRQPLPRPTWNPRRRSLVVAGAALTLLFGTLQARSQDADSNPSGKNHKSIGISATEEATAKDVGLPIYPGARPRKDKGDDISSFNVGLWSGDSEFKLVILKMESGDPPAKVEAFYRNALGKYGNIVNCADSPPMSDEAKTLCDSDHESQAKSGGVELRAGIKAAQHIVGVQPKAGGTLFQASVSTIASIGYQVARIAGTSTLAAVTEA